MSRPHLRRLPALAACALFSACGGVSETGFFGPAVDGAGAGGSSQAGATSNAGGSSGSPGNAAGASNPGGSSSGGQPANAGGQPMGGANSGGFAGSLSSGAAAAAAGSSGSGGHSGSAGSTGGFTSSGAGGTSSDCSELIKQGTRQLEAARVCNLAADALQCTGKVTNRCKCQIPVQRLDSTETKAYLETLKQLDAKNCVPTCSTVCAPLMSAACSPSSSSTGAGPTGTCVASNNGPVP